MSDPTGVPSGLGIESVEWFAEGGENITVRVTGRWRKRRPAWTGRALLVIEAQGRRHRFPAMPEPPSLTGSIRGTWRMNFSIPSALAPHLRGHAWLRLGAVVLPLPMEVVAASEGESEALGSTGTLERAQRRDPDAGRGDRDEPEHEPEREPEPERDDAVKAVEPTAPVREDPAPARGPAPENPEPDAPEPDVPEPSATTPPAAKPQAPRSPTAPTPAPPPEPDAGTIAERRLRSAELAVEASRSRLTQAEQLSSELSRRIEELEVELADARREPERLTAVLAERERRVRAAEQRAYAERALREELEEELAERERELSVSAEIREELAVQQSRVRELEEELELVRRRADEAEQLAAAAKVGRQRAERRASELEEQQTAASVGPGREVLTSGVQNELALAGMATGTPPAPAAPAAAAADMELLALERAMAERSRAEAAEARAAALEAELRTQADRVSKALQAIEGLRGELEAVRRERARELLTLPAGGQVDPERLAAALMRLRTEAHEPGAVTERAPDPEPDFGPDPVALEPAAPAPPTEAPPSTAPTTAPPPRPETTMAAPPAPAPTRPVASRWLQRVYRELSADDPTAAGLLAIRLLPALRRVHPAPLAFDLVLAELGSVRVTIATDAVAVQAAASPRSREDTSFRVVGDVQSLARLLRSGSVRRRLARNVARVEGQRKSIAALLELVRAPVDLLDLHAAGVRLEPWLALTVAAYMVRPAWTRGERFTLAHIDPDAPGASSYLHIRDGERLLVSQRTPLGPVAGTIVSRRDELLAVLGGQATAEFSVRGEERPLLILMDWIDRAQSG